MDECANCRNELTIEDGQCASCGVDFYTLNSIALSLQGVLDFAISHFGFRTQSKIYTDQQVLLKMRDTLMASVERE